MTEPTPDFVAASRRRDLLLTLVMLCIALTPAWLTPSWFSIPWFLVVGVLGAPAVVLTWQHGPWVPTPAAELPRIVAALGLRPGERFCDLGAGDGRMVLWVHRATGAPCTGIEASPLMVLIARIRLAVQGGRDTTIRLGDLYRADLTDFDVVYVWGTRYSVGTPRFRDQVLPHMRPGARLISYHTPLDGLTATTVDEGGQRPIYTYVMPASA